VGHAAGETGFLSVSQEALQRDTKAPPAHRPRGVRPSVTLTSDHRSESLHSNALDAFTQVYLSACESACQGVFSVQDGPEL